MLTIYKETVGDLHLVLRSDGSIYVGRVDEYGVIDLQRDALRLGGSAAICGALAEALGRVANVIRVAAALRPKRFDEEKPPAGHHAPAPEESEGM